MGHGVEEILLLEDLAFYEDVANRSVELLGEILKEGNVTYSYIGADVLISARKRVGVQGDNRTEYFPLEIEVRTGDELSRDLLKKISNKICNELPINTVLYRIS